MSVSVETKGLAEKVFDSFKKISPALIAVALASGFVLFLPESILKKMALNNLQDIWKIVTGLVFVVSCALIITIAIVEEYRVIQKKVAPKKFRKRKRKQFINLPLDYKKMLVNILKSPKRSMELDPTSGDTLYLLNNQFIHRTQSYMFVGPGYTDPIACAPEPWLIDLFFKEPELFKL